ncbi:hypothetical protein AGMMS50229_00230 [Campylobacterota bacterium]|nr:hypothetical protein AGMMS50229_00230 [Campylobacterota bacterium]
MNRFLICSLGGGFYAFEASAIAEVVGFDTFYPLPLLPSYAKGLINRFATPYLLIDTALFLAIGGAETKKVLVLKEQIDRLAFTIDDCIDIVDVDENTVQTITDAHQSYLNGVFEYRKNDVFIVDHSAMIEQFNEEFVL